MPDIFLSYCRDDSLTMRVVSENLRKLGFNVWIDDEDLTPGTQDWVHAIEEAIEQAGATVALLSPAAKQSVWVNREILRTQRYPAKKVFPVLIAGDELSAIPMSLEGAQYADMRGRSNYEAEFRKLVRGLARHFAMAVAEFEMDFSGPSINVQVYGDIAGGTLNVAGRDVVTHIPPEPAPVGTRYSASAPPPLPLRTRNGAHPRRAVPDGQPEKRYAP